VTALRAFNDAREEIGNSRRPGRDDSRFSPAARAIWTRMRAAGDRRDWTEFRRLQRELIDLQAGEREGVAVADPALRSATEAPAMTMSEIVASIERLTGRSSDELIAESREREQNQRWADERHVGELRERIGALARGVRASRRRVESLTRVMRFDQRFSPSQAAQTVGELAAARKVQRDLERDLCELVQNDPELFEAAIARAGR
jgi:hypothetical protein